MVLLYSIPSTAHWAQSDCQRSTWCCCVISCDARNWWYYCTLYSIPSTAQSGCQRITWCCCVISCDARYWWYYCTVYLVQRMQSDCQRSTWCCGVISSDVRYWWYSTVPSTAQSDCKRSTWCCCVIRCDVLVLMVLYLVQHSLTARGVHDAVVWLAPGPPSALRSAQPG